MRVFPHISLVCRSPLSPAEIVRRVQASTLPLVNTSWRDDYQINPGQPFQGFVENDSFEIARLDVSQVRRATPPKIKGWVKAVAGDEGSEVQLQYYQRVMWKLVLVFIAFSVGLSVASVLQDWQRQGIFNLLGLAYLALPVFAALVHYLQLRNEFGKVQPLLNQLLALEETAV